MRVSAKLLMWPNSCACCMGERETRRSAVLLRKNSKGRMENQSWPIPYCDRCERRIDSGRCDEAVVYVALTGTFNTFDFWNEDFADEFRRLNRDKLIG